MCDFHKFPVKNEAELQSNRTLSFGTCAARRLLLLVNIRVIPLIATRTSEKFVPDSLSLSSVAFREPKVNTRVNKIW